MNAWSENGWKNGFGDKELIVATGNNDFTSKTTIIDMGDFNKSKKKGRLGNIIGPIGTEEEGKRNFAERFRDFGNSTTFHGIGNVTNNKHNGLRRLLWLLIVLGVSTWLIIDIAIAIIQYFQYPVTSSISINYVDNITFPAVTLCNFNQFRRSSFDEDMVELVSKLYTSSNVDVESIDFGSLNDITGLNQDDIEEVMASLSHDLETMLMECNWNSAEKCTTENFTRRFTDHGVCFTFNEPEDVTERLQVRNAGSRNGLYLRLFAETDEYTIGENTAAGFRILLHPQGVAPLVKELGFSVSPGFESSIAVRQNLVKSLEYPYKSNCTKSTLKYSDTYTVPACRFECKVDYVVERCGCRDYRWPGPAPPCSPVQQFQCVYPYEVEFQRNEIKCSCPVSCLTKTYESRISLGYWPGSHIVDYLSSLNITEEFIRKNYLDVYIYFEELMYLEIEQAGKYSISTLQSTIGGYMGLLCGMSLITLIEWADFIGISLIRKCRSGKM